jgi:hypothetical protein
MRLHIVLVLVPFELLLIGTLPLAKVHSQETAKKAPVSHFYEDSEGYELLSVVLGNEAKTLKLDRFEIFGRTVISSVRLSLSA